jgi:uncharacterized cupin superfamily protein
MHEAIKELQGAIIHTLNGDFDLEPVDLDALPPAEEMGYRIEGNPEVKMKVVWASEDRRTAVCVESINGPARVVGKHYNDVFYLISGGWTGTQPDGSKYEVKAGDFAVFPEGQEDDCTVPEGFLKCAFYHSSKPLAWLPEND